MDTKVPLSHSLWSPNDTVKDVAELLGISLPDDAARNLAMDVEYRIHEILETAALFMRHSKRKTLASMDLAAALRTLNIEPLYGYDNSQTVLFKQALVGAGGLTLYYIDEHELDFEKIVNAELPPVPRISSFTAHWLAIEGVQPIVPQNPLPADIKALPPPVRGATSSILNNDLFSSSLSATELPESTLDSSHNDTSLPVRPLVRHVLSKELKLFFDKVVAALVSTDPEKDHLKMAALSSLKSDPGLHQLVPYLIQFVAEQITNHLHSIDLLSTMLEVISALADNKTVFLDPYVHALMPCILTLLLAKRLGLVVKDKSKSEYNDALRSQMAVREFAAILLRHIVTAYGSSYSTLRPRVTRTLLRALLNPGNPAGTHFGALLGLKNMGGEVVRLVLLGNVRAWWLLVEQDDNFSDFERSVLQNGALDALRSLEATTTEPQDDSSAAENKGTDSMDVDAEWKVLPEVASRLDDRLGKALASVVLAQPDARQLVAGIFFGEITL